MGILVLHPGALGDLILSLPALGAIRRHFPEAQVTVAGNLDFLSAITRGYADQTQSLSALPLHRLFTPAPLPERDILFWKSYDKLISWTGAGDEIFERQLRAANPAAIISAWRPRPSDPRHVSQIFIDTLDSCVSAADLDPKIKVTPDEEALCRGENWLRAEGWTRGQELIAIHPGAGNLTKRWPAGRYCALARQLAQKEGPRLLIVEGPAEVGIASEVTRGIPSRSILTARSLCMRELAGVLARCRIFVGHDSGVSHLAAGLGVPSLLLFGPTLPQHWAPRGDHVKILWDPGGCEGCDRGSEQKHTCLENISLERVSSDLEKLLPE